MTEALITEAISKLPELTQSRFLPQVNKRECKYSLDKLVDFPSGLYVNLKNLHSVAKRFLQADYDHYGFPLYLHIQYIKYRPVVQPGEQVLIFSKEIAKFEAPANCVSFKTYFENGTGVIEVRFASLVVFPGFEAFVYPSEARELNLDQKLKSKLLDFLGYVFDADLNPKIEKKEEIWMEMEIPVSRFAENLIQLDNGKKINSNFEDWECEESGIKENLWLNLSTGYIGSGRPHADGSGGTGAALRHYKETGKKYPLAVKLGTITSDGAADVYSYAEDEMVRDPWLAKHLAHWGLDLTNMKKSDASIQEMEIKANISFELLPGLKAFNAPGLRGIKSEKNTSHLVSAFQLFLCIPEIRDFYAELLTKNAFHEDVEGADLQREIARISEAIHRSTWIDQSEFEKKQLSDHDFEIILPQEVIDFNPEDLLVNTT
jgi:ubiquitin carboxyl-terminal hydrolase 5/13